MNYTYTEHTLDTDDLYTLCNRYQWFTSGTVKQYDKLFECNREGASIERLAAMIWICSNNADYDFILSELEMAKRKRDEESAN